MGVEGKVEVMGPDLQPPVEQAGDLGFSCE